MLTDLTTSGARAKLLPWLLVALVIALLASAGVGAWIGWEITRGRAAIADQADQTAALKDLRDQTKALAETAATLSQDYAAAVQRMEAIADKQEQDRARIKATFDAQRTALDELLRTRPELRDLDLGPDVLRHWNGSNAGAAPAAPAQPSGKRDPGLPGPTAGIRCPCRDVAGQPRCGCRDLSPMPQHAWQRHRGHPRMVVHGVGLVLQSAGTVRTVLPGLNPKGAA